MGDLTVQEAAEYLGVSGQYVRRMLKKGRIQGRQHGQACAWIVNGKSLESFKKLRNS